MCGARSYTITVKDSSNNVVTSPTFISIDSATGLITLNPSASPPSGNVGSFTAVIRSTLTNYGSVAAYDQNLSFTIGHCIVTSITQTGGTIVNVVFTLTAQTSLSYTYPTYTQSPACNYASFFSHKVDGVV